MPLSFPSGVTEIQLEFFNAMETRALIQSDFTEGLAHAEGVNTIAAGAGAGVFGVGLGFTENHPGVWQLNTGSTAVGRVFVLSRVNAYQLGVGGETQFQSWINLPFLSTALQRFVARTGFASVALPNTLLQSIGFEYQDDEGANWQALCHDGAETSVDTGVLVVAGRWYKHTFTVNAAGTSVEFFIDDVSVATITTNLPTGVGFGHFVNMHIMKLFGVIPRNYLLDAYAVYQEVVRD